MKANELAAIPSLLKEILQRLPSEDREIVCGYLKQADSLGEALAKAAAENVSLKLENVSLKSELAAKDQEIIRLKDIVEALEGRLGMNSSNSSMPPSSDFPKPNRGQPKEVAEEASSEEPKNDVPNETSDGKTTEEEPDGKPHPESLRTPSGRKPGGQKGHKGSGFALPKKEPDEIIPCIPDQCRNCPNSAVCAERQTKITTRYVRDIEIRPILKKYTAYRRDCPMRNGECLEGSFPPGVTGSKQYGELISILGVGLYLKFNVSYDKIHQFLMGITGFKSSVGWGFNKVKKLAENLTSEQAIEQIRQKLLKADVLVCDETGVRVPGENAWAHTASTSNLTYQTASDKRGVDGMKEGGLLQHYDGHVAHDCWQSYWTLDNPEQKPPPEEDKVQAAPSAPDDKKSAIRKHCLCNQHLLRELRWVCQYGPGRKDGKQRWAKEYALWLKTIYAYCLKAKEQGKRCLSKAVVENLRDVLLSCVEVGMANNEMELYEGMPAHKRKVRALLLRLYTKIEEYTRFMTDFRLPFSTNQAERDLRPLKTRIAVSGCFRTLVGLKRFVKLHSILSTGAKNGVDWVSVFKGLALSEPIETFLRFGQLDQGKLRK